MFLKWRCAGVLRTGECVGKAPVFIKLGGGIQVETKEDTKKTTSEERRRKEKRIRKEEVRNE
jgi:hypothetical protein